MSFMSLQTKFKMKFGLRSKLSLPIIIGVLIIVCILFFVWQPLQLKKAKNEFIEEQTKILKTLNPSLIRYILSNDLSSLHSTLENSLIIHKNTWQYIQIINADKRQLFPIFTQKPKFSDTIIDIQLSLEENEEIFGEIYLFTDWGKEKKKQTENIIQINIWSIILFAIIAIANFIIQTKWIFIPITKLKDVTFQFSQGNYKTKVPAVSTDEIGSLTTSIEHMRDKIQVTLNELVDKEKMQRAILDSVPDAIITLNSQGIVQSFNPGAENIFQYQAVEVIGKNVKILMPENIALHHDQYLHDFSVEYKSNPTDINSNLNNIGISRELFGVKKDKSEFPIELTINAKIIDGEILITGVLRDITERKKVDRLKNEFISTVSHELRTPLTAIKGSLDLVTKGLNITLPEQASTMIDIANRNVERLLTLINDILDISKLESGEINFLIEEINIQSFIDSCIALNQEYAKKYNTKFICTHCDKDININVDKDRLSQVMSNLLSNAAKYSPDETPVEISTYLTNKTIRISVKDYGHGVPEEFRTRLFEKFTQSASGNTRQVGGTGLGLNISKNIIEKLGGNIGFESVIDEGSTFYFEFPITTDN